MGTKHFDEFKKENGFDNNETTAKIRKQLLKFLEEEDTKLVNK
jgi:hypothetical protein